MTEQQLLRQAKRRLAILQNAEEVTGNVSQRSSTATLHSPRSSTYSPWNYSESVSRPSSIGRATEVGW